VREIVLAGIGLVAVVATSCSSASPAKPGSSSTATAFAMASHSPGRSVAKAKMLPRSAPTRPAPRLVAPNPCVGNTHAQLVLVSVARQQVWMCAGARLVNQTAVTTGIPTEDFHTPTGSYLIQAKQTDQTLTLLSGAQYQVASWIPFDGPLFGFHDSSWQAIPYGSQKYRTDGSHGCVHMPLAAISWMYRWAQVGTAVTIRA